MKAEVLNQYRAVRESFGWRERTEVGWLSIRGADRFSWLQGMVTNDVRLLETGSVARLPACVLDATGHVLTDLALFTWEEAVLAELPRENLERIQALFDRYIIMEDVEVAEVTNSVGCLTLQGPDVNEETMARGVCGVSYAQLNIRLKWVSADHTGSGGADIYFPLEERARFFEALSAVEMTEIRPETWEILRIEAGIPKYGAELDESVIALEANLGPTHISLTKGCYVGQEIIARIDARGHTNRALTGMLVTGDALPAPGDKLYVMEDGGERETGRITSVAESSPAAGGKAIALGYVRHEHRDPETTLRVAGDGHATQVTTTELPFYRKPSL